MIEPVLIADPRVRGIPVAESGDDLVDLRGFDHLAFSDLKSDETPTWSWVRRGLADRVAAAATSLPTDVRLLIVEGHRSPAWQRHHFETYRAALHLERPGLDEATLTLLTSRHISPPDVAPHTAGAAIDLTLSGPDGRELDLGTPVNATPEESDGACYTAATTISAEARHLRTVLAEALGAQGLVNYPTEWWHWSWGDRYWAFVTGASQAVYGPVEAHP